MVQGLFPRLVGALSAALLCTSALATDLSPSGTSTGKLPSFSKLVVFGDGLSDQGLFGLLTQNRYPPSPPFFEGRWTNGFTWVEHMASAGGWPLTASDNLAQGGATTGYYNINEPLRAALQLNASAPIRGVRAQVDAYTSEHKTLDPRALFVVWAGGHDIGAYLDYGQPDIRKQAPAANIQRVLEQLKAAGARHVLLGTMPDMGNTPGYVGTEKEAKASALVQEYNLALTQLADAMRKSGMHISVLDGAAAFARAGREAAQRGIKYFSEAYLSLDYLDFQNPLASPKPIPSGRIPGEFFSFWAVSASATVHEVIAEQALDTLRKDYAVPAKSKQIDLLHTPEHLLHWGPGRVAFVATNADGAPDAAVITLNRGQTQSPYTSEDGRIRLATVLKGTLSFGDGLKVDQRHERLISTGETVIIQPSAPFWVAARHGAVRIWIQILPLQSQVTAAQSDLVHQKDVK